MRIIYKAIMYLPNKLLSLTSLLFGFIGEVGKLLLRVIGSILGLGAIIIFFLDKAASLSGIVLAILSVLCLAGQSAFAVLQKGIFTVKNWYSSKL